MLKLKVDVSPGLERRIAKALELDVQYTLDDAVKESVEDIRAATPIDTGYARSRWTSYKQNSFKFSFSFKNPLLFSVIESRHVIENDADYIQYLNAGSSKQAPAYFVERTLLQNGLVPTII